MAVPLPRKAIGICPPDKWETIVEALFQDYESNGGNWDEVRYRRYQMEQCPRFADMLKKGLADMVVRYHGGAYHVWIDNKWRFL